LVNWSGVIILGWAIIQALTWRIFQRFPDWMWDFQGMVSSSLLLYTNRANGFAYEPSWLAHQLNMVYLPFWLAATVSGVTVHKKKLRNISLENVLLLGGVVVMLLSVSRIGLLAFLFMLAYLILQWNIRLVHWLQKRLLERFAAGGSQGKPTQKIKRIKSLILAASIGVLLLFYAGLLTGAAYGLSRYDERMKKIFEFSIMKEKSFFYYANQLVFAERIVFWQAGWEVFGDYPILGVGLGNAGFFFPEKLSAFSWSLSEIRTLMYQWTALPNIKSLWVRLLAETGLIGIAFFASWYYVLWQSARFLRKNSFCRSEGSIQLAQQKLYRVIGLMGTFVLVAILIEGFSIDTFALPYYWFSFGLLTAACELSRQQTLEESACPCTAFSLEV
ncbi:MAG: O-antigen ligase family protein, partial [Anaerolineaceae bacterium]|nr:O-antigen ligase family protein [Anaerolineaceae bacterium]